MQEAVAVMNACAGLPLPDLKTKSDPMPHSIFEHITDEIMQGRLDEARIKAKECVSEFPESARAHYLKGICLAKLEKMTEALSYLERAVLLFPQFAEAQYSLGNIYRILHEFEKALMHYHTALHLSAQDSDFGKLVREEVDAISQSIREFSGLNAYASLANKRNFDKASTAISRGEFEIAIQLLHKVLNFERNHHGALLNLGLLYASLGNVETGLDYISRALQVFPDDALAIQSREEILKLKEGERYRFPFGGAVTQYYKIGA